MEQRFVGMADKAEDGQKCLHWWVMVADQQWPEYAAAGQQQQQARAFK
jgi:hypothetical protein